MELENPERIPLSGIKAARFSLLKLARRVNSVEMRRWVLIWMMVLAAVGILGCSGGENGESEVSSPVSELATEPVVEEPAVTPAPVPTESSKATATAVEGENGQITGEDVLATAFDQWGSTCLNDAYPENAPQLDDVADTDLSTDPNGLEFVTIKDGEGAQPKLDWEVDVQYTGWLEDGCIFDSSYTRSQSAVFPVGAVIPGWQMTLTQMKIGERRRVVIPPDLAYGVEGSPPVIPANATLTFDIILVSGTNPDAANAAATQVADDLLVQATALAKVYDADAAPFEPILVDYVTDAQGFLGSIPEGELTCMIAYAGSPEVMAQFFSSATRPNTVLLERFDECLSNATTRNIAAGRIAIIGTSLSDETLECVGETLENPTLKPLFGVFDAAQVSEEWISAHFCMNADERTEFEKALFADQPNRTDIGSGKTFIDVQECMVDELGAELYFEPVQQPNTADREVMEAFFTNFTPFMIADIKCRQGDVGHAMADGSTMSVEAAQCAADRLGPIRFGEVFLDRTWVPTAEEHIEVTTIFNECGVTTDFLDLPDSLGNVDVSDLSCLLEELTNSDDPSETSVRAFGEFGARNQIKAGDFVALLFSAETCDLKLAGIPQDAELGDTSAMCILDKVDPSLYEGGATAVIPAFDTAVAASADCFADQ